MSSPAAAGSNRPVTPREAASVLLARDGPEGCELFMLARPRQASFASGALVFPGGSVDHGDRDPGLRERADGADGLDERSLALRIAAIREAFEECGVLLARAHGERTIVDGERVAAIRRRFAAELARHALDMRALAESEDLTLACDQLVPFAHWITPETQPKRFDTHFFLAAAPSGHAARHDGHEAIDSFWITPAGLGEKAGRADWHVMFPTRLNAEKLGRSATVAEAFAAARDAPVVTVMPEGQKVAGGRRLRIPAEAGYGLTVAHVDARGSVTRIE